MSWVGYQRKIIKLELRSVAITATGKLCLLGRILCHQRVKLLSVMNGPFYHGLELYVDVLI